MARSAAAWPLWHGGTVGGAPNAPSSQRVVKMPERYPKPRERGMGLVEVVSALAVLTLAALGVVSGLFNTAKVDESLRERNVAMRAATSQMELLLAYDYEGNIQNLVDFLAQPVQQTFQVESLKSPRASALEQSMLALNPVGGNLKCGYVNVDASDLQRVRMNVSVHWTSRTGEDRRFTLPMTVSAVTPQ